MRVDNYLIEIFTLILSNSFLLDRDVSMLKFQTKTCQVGYILGNEAVVLGTVWYSRV